MLYIGIIWLIGFVFDLPEFFALHVKESKLRFDVKLFAQCITSWTQEQEQRISIVKAICLYT